MVFRSFARARLGAAAGAAFAVCAHSGFAMANDAAAPDDAPLAAAQAFLNGNALAMNKMMAAMAVSPTGDIDKDFVAMMIPHHQGAIDMAKLLLCHGGNQQLKYLAQEIIITQQQEIAAMRLAIGEPLPAPQSSATSCGDLQSDVTAVHAHP